MKFTGLIFAPFILAFAAMKEFDPVIVRLDAEGEGALQRLRTGTCE